MTIDTEHESTAQRFSRLLACYGADPSRWPDAERVAAQRFLDNNVSARIMMREALELDQWLQSPMSQPPAFAGLEARLLQRKLSASGAGALERVLAWLSPAPDFALRQLWRPVAMACLPLAIGLLVGFQFELAPEVYATTFEEELYLISLSDYAEIL